MRSLHRVKIKRGQGGDPLPAVFPALEEKGIRPRRGQVTMIAAPPNGFKSGLALYWVLRLAERHSLTVLYVSADTDPATNRIRTLAMLTGQRTEVIERESLEGGQVVDWYDEMLLEIPELQFSFDDAPTWGYMQEVILAHCEKWGAYPDILVVDNLMNVVEDSENEWSAMKEVTKGLHHMAWQTQSSVFVLHHQNEGTGDPTKPAPRKQVAGKVNQIPEMVISLGFDPQAGILRLAAVKNRSGPHDASGEDFATLLVDPPSMTLFNSTQDKQQRIAA